MPTKRTKGRCLCGSLKYEFEGKPEWVAYCHCDTCRRHTSSSVATFVGVKIGQFEYLEGTPAAYESSPGVWRYFCPKCGSPMAYTNDEKSPGHVHLYIGTLEHPETFVPAAHVHASEQLSWFEVDDALPRFSAWAKEAKPSRVGPRKR